MKAAFVLAIGMAAAASLAPRDIAAQATDKIYFEFQVTKPVAQAPGSKAPRYPVELKSKGIEGEVLIQFVVDTFGVAESTNVRVLKASHGLFTDAVLAVLPDMRFTPAELNGHKVRQLVQQPFVFNIQRVDALVPGARVSARPGQPSPEPEVPLPVLTPHQAMMEMRDALTQLVVGEEAYWALHESYTTDLVAVRAGIRKQPTKRVTVSIHSAGGRAWAASAVHRDLPKHSCVIYVGSAGDFPVPATLKSGLRPTSKQTGWPLCDDL